MHGALVPTWRGAYPATVKSDVLVLGGTGFIGLPLVHALLGAGRSVAVFHRGHQGGDLPDEVPRVIGDRHDLTASADALRSVAPQIVIDVIAYTESEAQASTDLFADIAERFVVLSSQDVYLGYDRFRGLEAPAEDPRPADEEAPLRTRHFPYRGQAETGNPWIDEYDKILVEQAYAARGSTTVLRLPMVYGPRDRQHRLLPYLKRMDDGRPAICLETARAAWRTTRGYVDDVAAAVALACIDDRAAGRTYNVGERDPLTEAEWVAAIGAAAEWTGEIVEIPAELWPARWATPYRWDQTLVVDTARIRDELGFAEPVERAEGIRRTVEWERTQSPATASVEQEYEIEDRLLERLRESG